MHIVMIITIEIQNMTMKNNTSGVVTQGQVPLLKLLAICQKETKNDIQSR